MAFSHRKSASFAWDILKSDLKLIFYPILRIVSMFVVLAIMWPLIFDISSMEVAESLTRGANSEIERAATQKGGSPESLPGKEPSKLENNPYPAPPPPVTLASSAAARRSRLMRSASRATARRAWPSCGPVRFARNVSSVGSQS